MKSGKIHLRGETRYTTVVPDDEGWRRRPATGVEMCATDDRHLAIRVAGNAATGRALPD